MKVKRKDDGKLYALKKVSDFSYLNEFLTNFVGIHDKIINQRERECLK